MTVSWRPVGSIRGPAGPPGPGYMWPTFSMQGQLRVMVGAGRFPIRGGTFVVESVAATVEAEGAPTGSPIIVDVRANGTSIYLGHLDQRPTIGPGEIDAAVGEHNETVLDDGDALNVDVVQVGSLVPGEFLTVVVGLQQIVALDAT